MPQCIVQYPVSLIACVVDIKQDILIFERRKAHLRVGQIVFSEIENSPGSTNPKCREMWPVFVFMTSSVRRIMLGIVRCIARVLLATMWYAGGEERRLSLTILQMRSGIMIAQRWWTLRERERIQAPQVLLERVRLKPHARYPQAREADHSEPGEASKIRSNCSNRIPSGKPSQDSIEEAVRKWWLR